MCDFLSTHRLQHSHRIYRICSLKILPTVNPMDHEPPALKACACLWADVSFCFHFPLCCIGTGLFLQENAWAFRNGGSHMRLGECALDWTVFTDSLKKWLLQGQQSHMTALFALAVASNVLAASLWPLVGEVEIYRSIYWSPVLCQLPC